MMTQAKPAAKAKTGTRVYAATSFDAARDAVEAALAGLDAHEDGGSFMTTTADAADIWGEASTLYTVDGHGHVEIRDGDDGGYVMVAGADATIFGLESDAMEGDDIGAASTNREAAAMLSLRALGVPYRPLGAVLGFKIGSSGRIGFQRGPTRGITFLEGGEGETPEDTTGYPLPVEPGAGIQEMMRLSDWCAAHMRQIRGEDGDRPLSPSLTLLVDLDFRDGVPQALGRALARESGYRRGPHTLTARFRGREPDWAADFLANLPADGDAYRSLRLCLAWDGTSRAGAVETICMAGFERRALAPMVQAFGASAEMGRRLRRALGSPRLVEYGS